MTEKKDCRCFIGAVFLCWQYSIRLQYLKDDNAVQKPDSERKDAEYKKRSFLYSASKNQFLCKQTQRSSRVARFFYCKPNFRK